MIILNLKNDEDLATGAEGEMRLLSLCLFLNLFLSTQAESMNSDLQRGLDRSLRHTTMYTEQNQSTGYGRQGDILE